MQVKFTREHVKILRENDLDNRIFQSIRYEDELMVNIFLLKKDYYDRLLEFVRADEERSRIFNGLLQRASLLDKVSKNPTRNLKDMAAFATAMSLFLIKSCPNRLLFAAEAEVPTPYLFVDCKYYPARRDRSGYVEPARVTLELAYYTKGLVNFWSIHWDYATIVGGINVERALLDKGLIVETPDLVDRHDELVADYKRKADMDCAQFLYTSDVLPDDDGSYRTDRSAAISQLGVFRVVCETSQYHPSNNRGRTDPAIQIVVESGIDIDEEEILDDEELDVETVESAANDRIRRELLKKRDVFLAPLHPIIYCFNLETHSHMWLESWKLSLYEYDVHLVDKVILPEEHKELLRLLVENPDTLQADIVAGKSGSTFILSAGPPGTGKTLSAEAYAEGTKRILYSIQSDQLGVDPDVIERNLKDVFARAFRWNAVLLIDEADIYIRKRGVDIHQNAIIGTFLRTIEYYSGHLFMTTNLYNDIDDAVVSRCSAVIQYEYPTGEDAKLIFDQFAELFELTVDRKVRDEFLGNHTLSGRSIKNVLRLTARRGFASPTYEQLRSSASFVHTAKN